MSIPHHRNTGAALGLDCELEPVTMRCTACGLNGAAPLRKSKHAHSTDYFCSTRG